jgi:putative phage-type endonuclease
MSFEVKNRVEVVDRVAWLRERTKYVTASEAAAVMGESPFKSPKDVARDKLGINTVRFEGNQLTWMGQHYEHPNMLAFAAASGYDCSLSGAFCVRRPLASTLDAICEVGRSVPDTPVEIEWVTGRPDPGTRLALELKNVTAANSRYWKPYPRMYWWQVQCQMFCAELDNALIVAKIDAHRLVAAHVKADSFAQEALVENAEYFLSHLEEIANG